MNFRSVCYYLLRTTQFALTFYIFGRKKKKRIMLDEPFFRHPWFMIMVFFLSFNISDCFEIPLCEGWSITNENNSKMNKDCELIVLCRVIN